MHYAGEGVPQDYAEAVVWYHRAAEQGDRQAQRALGAMYDWGNGVPQNYAEAVKWYRRAAEQGDKQAQRQLAVAYDRGEGVPQNYAEAVKWCRRAAGQGDAVAQVLLGFKYSLGEGVQKDLVLAHMWLNLGTAGLWRGEGRDMAVEQRDKIAEELSPAQLARAQQMARDWRPKPEADPEGVGLADVIRPDGSTASTYEARHTLMALQRDLEHRLELGLVHLLDVRPKMLHQLAHPALHVLGVVPRITLVALHLQSP